MSKRLELHEILKEILDSKNVYFQPPESIKLNYPCIIYKMKTPDVKFADDIAYKFTNCYDVTIIDKNPDTELIDEMFRRFTMIRLDRPFTKDNLNHYTFTLYF